MTKEQQQDFTTSIRVNPDVWTEFKIWCYRNNVAMSEKIEEMIKEVIKKK